MEMPKPAAEHHEMERLAGTWKGEEIMHPSPWMPEGGKALGQAVNRIALNGFAMVQEYDQRIGEAVVFRGHGVWTVDPKTREYLLSWFDSTGTGENVFRGRIEAGVLALVCRTAEGHLRAVYDLRAPGKYGFRMEVSGDGRAWQPMMEGTYTRVASA